MKSTRSLWSAVPLALTLALLGCDRADDSPGLPEATGPAAPARVEIPTPAKAAAGQGAYETVSHRWVGSVRAKHHVELAPGMTGVIADISVAEGDTVEAGQQVFRIAGSTVKAAVSQAQAGVAAAELQLREAERETERTRKLAERGSVGSASLERAQAGVEAAKAGVRQAKAATTLARSRTGDLTVESPISGIVTGKYKNVGEIATMMPPTVVLVIDDLSTIEVRVRVPELKLREIDVGSPVSVYFPALDRTHAVAITRIGNAVDPRTRTIELIIEVENPDLRIKSGMSVEVELGAREQAGEAEAEAEAAKPDAAKPDAAKPDAAKPNAASPTAMITPAKKQG